MNAELWPKVSAALDQLLKLPPAEQEEFLARLEEKDPALAADVAELLKGKSQDPFGLESTPQVATAPAPQQDEDNNLEERSPQARALEEMAQFMASTTDVSPPGVSGVQ